jgi:hypothetical protein
MNLNLGLRLQTGRKGISKKLAVKISITFFNNFYFYLLYYYIIKKNYIQNPCFFKSNIFPDTKYILVIWLSGLNSGTKAGS